MKKNSSGLFSRYVAGKLEKQLKILASMNQRTLEQEVVFRLFKTIKGIKIKSCEFCKKTFLCGGETHKRADGRFCSNNCRASFHYYLKKGEIG